MVGCWRVTQCGRRSFQEVFSLPNIHSLGLINASVQQLAEIRVIFKANVYQVKSKKNLFLLCIFNKVDGMGGDAIGKRRNDQLCRTQKRAGGKVYKCKGRLQKMAVSG